MRTEPKRPELLWAPVHNPGVSISPQSKGKRKNEHGKAGKHPPKNPDGPAPRFQAFILCLHGKEDIELLTPIARGSGKHRGRARLEVNTGWMHKSKSCQAQEVTEGTWARLELPGTFKTVPG